MPALTTEEILERLSTLIIGELNLRPTHVITRETEWLYPVGTGNVGADYLRVDSLDIVELVMGIEEVFGIELEDADMWNTENTTIGFTVDLIARKLEEKKAA